MSKEKATDTAVTTATQALDEKYRPKNLDQVIGHEAAVTRLRGMIKTGKIPGAILFTGPTSVGKTTLARALAAEINEKSTKKQGGDYKEVNGADTRTIEDVRELIKLSRFRPLSKKRIFVIDEVQQILSNNTAAQALLKPLEDAGSTDTLWILCSMDPEKFKTTAGRAMANRCAQFKLAAPDVKDLFLQAKRIRKGEGMDYLSDDALKIVAKNCNSEMRTLAHAMQGLRDSYEGMDKKPKTIAVEDIPALISGMDSVDAELVVAVIVNTLAGSYGKVHRALLDVAEPFPFINKLLWAAQFQLNVAVLGGERHPKVWWNDANKKISAGLKEAKPTLGQLGALNEVLVTLKQMSASFAVGEIELISAKLYRFIKDNVARKKE